MAYPLTVTEIETAISALAGNASYSAYLTVTDLPDPTAEGKRVKMLQIGTGTIPVLIVGGHHAREWAPPDAILAFAQKLLEAKRLGTAFTDTAFSWAASPADSTDPGYTGAITFPSVTILDVPTVNRIFANLKLLLIPCANPDGRKYSIDNRADPVKKDWRKNRRDLSVACGEFGVDNNRNYPTMFNYRDYYTVAAASTWLNIRVTDNPCVVGANASLTKNMRDTYQGTTTLEAETNNIKRVIDTNNIRFYLDVHSFQREIYYPWSTNPVQTTDNTKTYLNTTLNNVAGVGGRPLNVPATYGEYMPDPILQQHILIATDMHNRILTNAGPDAHAIARSDYTVKQAFTLYGAPGSSTDYACGTQFTASGNTSVTNAKSPVYAFTIEFGTQAEGGFQPLPDQFRKYQREIWSAMAGLTGYASTWVAPASGSGTGSGSGICPIILLFLLGSGFLLITLIVKIFF